MAEQLQYAQRILGYVSNPKDRALLYEGGVVEKLVRYTDVDWARNVGDCKSTYGFAFSLGSAAIAWSSKKQQEATNSCVVEHGGMAVITCEAIWLKRLLKDLQVQVSDPTTIYYDNLNNIQLAKNPVFHTRTKHTEVHYHSVCERVFSGEVDLMYAPTDR